MGNVSIHPRLVAVNVRTQIGDAVHVTTYECTTRQSGQQLVRALAGAHAGHLEAHDVVDIDLVLGDDAVPDVAIIDETDTPPACPGCANRGWTVARALALLAALRAERDARAASARLDADPALTATVVDGPDDVDELSAYVPRERVVVLTDELPAVWRERDGCWSVDIPAGGAHMYVEGGGSLDLMEAEALARIAVVRAERGRLQRLADGVAPGGAR